jgi:hypothetical protein
MTPYATELISIETGINYEPTIIRSDRRRYASETTSLGQVQIGELAQYGNSKGPIFKIEFVDLSSIATATHIKVWGIQNDDTNAPLFPISYINSAKKPIDVYLKKFIFCDSAGVEVDESGNYSAIGYKKNVVPTVY